MFEASRAKAINQLDNFVDNNLAEYSRLRNFDFGPDKRSNVSCLSPYITHGIISEKEVINKSLSKFSFSKNEKFISIIHGLLIHNIMYNCPTRPQRCKSILGWKN